MANELIINGQKIKFIQDSFAVEQRAIPKQSGAISFDVWLNQNTKNILRDVLKTSIPTHYLPELPKGITHGFAIIEENWLLKARFNTVLNPICESISDIKTEKNGKLKVKRESIKLKFNILYPIEYF